MQEINVLLEEKKNLREEILSIKKVIYTSLFSTIGIIAAFCAYLIGKRGLSEFLNSDSFAIYLVIICQVEFIIAMLIFSLDSTVETINGYISTIDDKINKILSDNTLLWQTHRKVFQQTGDGAEFFCMKAIYSYFTLIFVVSTIFILIELLDRYNIIYLVFLNVQFIELGISIFIIVKKRKEFNNVRNYFTQLRISK